MSGLLLLFLLEILLFVVAFALSGKDILAPSVMMCAMFLISTFFAILNAKKWNIRYYSPEAVFLLTSGIFCFIVAEAFCQYLFRQQKYGTNRRTVTIEPSYNVRPWKLNVILVFGILICILQFWNIVRTVGGNLSSDITHIFSLNRHMGTIQLATSGGTVNLGILSQLIKILTASGYLSSYLFVYNMVFQKGKWVEQGKHLVIMALSLVPSLMSGSRSVILRLMCAIMVEYYIAWHQKWGWHRNLSWRYIRYGIITLVAGMPIFYHSAKMLGRTPSAPIFDYISEYLGASIQLFNLYVLDPIPKIIMGEESLFSLIKVLHFLGLSKASTSYNLEVRDLGTEGSSNVYTFFRRPLHDFGILGMYVFTAIIAMGFAYIYFKKIKQGKGKQTIGWVLIYGFLYYWIVSSSILQYSVAYISVGTCITLVFLLALCKMVVKQCPVAGRCYRFPGKQFITRHGGTVLQRDDLCRQGSAVLLGGVGCQENALSDVGMTTGEKDG